MRLPFRHPGVSFLEPLPTLASFQPVFPPSCLGIIGSVFNMNQPEWSPSPCSRNPTLHMISHALTKIMGAAFVHVCAPVSKQNIYAHGRLQIIRIHTTDCNLYCDFPAGGGSASGGKSDASAIPPPRPNHHSWLPDRNRTYYPQGRGEGKHFARFSKNSTVAY